MKQRVKDLVAQGDALFAGRSSLTALWQEIADNFYPERAEFTHTRTIGADFASHLATSAPVLARRELGDQFAAMLRPRGKDWFKLTVQDEAVANDVSAKAWLEAKGNTMRRIMYDRRAAFTTATKEGDHDFAAFGQCVMSIEPNQDLDGLLYRTWHMRDCAWSEDANRLVDTMHRKWVLPARSVRKLFPKTYDRKLDKICEKEPHIPITLRHIVIPADEYDLTNSAQARRRERFPFVSIFVDELHDTILEETPLKRFRYVVPRWQSVSGSPYAFSPATVVGLADARLLQRITLTLLEAGEKAVNPPMIAAGDMIQSGINTYAGGVTWVDADYDERSGEALRTLGGEMKGNLAFGLNMADRAEGLIKRAFYLDQIRMPPAGGAMTATEVRQRIEEYIRAALPLFEPLELEYNGGIAEETFYLIQDNGGFGNFQDMPEVLRGQEVKFAFESPLQAEQRRDKATAFQEAAQLLAAAVQIDPQATAEIDVRTAFRDALDGAQVPAKWIVPDERAQQSRQAAMQAQKMQQTAQEVGGAAQVAGAVGDAAARLQAAGLVPQAGQAAAIQGAPV